MKNTSMNKLSKEKVIKYLKNYSNNHSINYDQAQKKEE